jgi:hypothetical protein
MKKESHMPKIARSTSYVPLFSVVLITVIHMSAAPAHAFQVTAVTAQVSPQNYSGPCPATVMFTGTITVDGAGQVTYRWEHSPGTGKLETITFAQAGTKIVTKSYSSDHQDFLELATITPNAKTQLASFTVQCAAPRPDLTIARSPTLPIAPQKLPKADDPSTLRIVVMNIGTAAYAPPPMARVVVRNKAKEILGVADLSASIPTGGKATLSIPIKAPKPFEAQSAALIVTVDDANKVPELREDNNAITIQASDPKILKRRIQ